MAQFNISTLRLATLLISSAVCGTVIGNIGLSFADNNADTSTLVQDGIVVPYDGYLMLDSAPVNATNQQLRFSLYETASGGTSQWSETQNVSVNNGKFSVALGKGTKVSSSPANAIFNEVVLDAEKLYIGIEVDDGTGNFVELSGRQAIEMAPYAAWSATSADFNVSNDLNVGGSANVNGPMTAGSLAVTGNINTSGSISAAGIINANNGLNLNSSALTDVATIDAPSTGGIEIYGSNTTSGTASLLIEPDHDVKLRDDIYVGGGTVYMDATASPKRALQNSSTALELNPDADFNLVRVESNLTVTGDVSVTGDVTANGQYRNLDNSFSVSSYSENSSSADMIDEDDGFCFLTRVYMDGEYSNPDAMACEVEVTGGTWRLVATEGVTRGLNPNIDNVRCRARCVTWTR